MGGLFIKNIKEKGRGVFAGHNFRNGEIIEECPVIIISETERSLIEKTILDYYIFPWKSDDLKDGVVALGFGSLYNHSYEPMASWNRDFEKRAIVIKALKDIRKDDEITINYNWNPDDKDSVDWMYSMPQR